MCGKISPPTGIPARTLQKVKEDLRGFGSDHVIKDKAVPIDFVALPAV